MAASSADSASPSPETTPEQWDRIKAFLRALPPSDSLSRTAQSRERERELVATFLSQHVSLIQLFLALDQATRRADKDRLHQVARAVNRCFTSALGMDLLTDPLVLPHLVLGMRHPEEEVRRLTTKILSENLQLREGEGGGGEGEEREEKRQALIRRLSVGTGDAEDVVSSLSDPALDPPSASPTSNFPMSVAAALAQGIADPSIAVAQSSADALLSMMRTCAFPSAPTAHIAPLLAHIHRFASVNPDVLRNQVLRLRYADVIARAFALADVQPSLHASLASPSTGPALALLFDLARGASEGGTADELIRFSALELLEAGSGTARGARSMSEAGIVRLLLGLARG
ncbi:hypothetical protein Naga_100560g1, partial [Nannochloropsis gaditana]